MATSSRCGPASVMPRAISSAARVAQRVEQHLLGVREVVGDRRHMRRRVAQRDALALAAQVVQRRGRQRRQRDDKSRARLRQPRAVARELTGETVQRVATAATRAQLMEQSVALLEHAAVSRHVRRRLRIGLREDDVEKAAPPVGTAAHESKVLRPEEHDRDRRRARERAARGLPSTIAVRVTLPDSGVALEPRRQRDVRRRPLHVGLGERRVLAPEQQVAACVVVRGDRVSARVAIASSRFVFPCAFWP